MFGYTFFFLKDKGKSLKAKRLKRVYTKYTKIQRIKKQGSDPYLVANQFTKSNNDKV